MYSTDDIDKVVNWIGSAHWVPTFMKTIPPVCENGGKGLRASCTRLPTIGSPHWVGEGQRAEGGVASLSLASFLEEGSGWHLLVGISKGVQEKS